MKKLLRLIVKIPTTPFYLVFFVCMYITGTVVQFWQWLYEVDNWDRKITSELLADLRKGCKRWFTTI